MPVVFIVKLMKNFHSQVNILFFSGLFLSVEYDTLHNLWAYGSPQSLADLI